MTSKLPSASASTEAESAARRRRRLRALWTAAGLMAASCVAMVGARIWIARACEGRIGGVLDAPAIEVTLVLGAGLNDDGTPTPFLAARLDRAMELYRSGRTKVLLVSGDNREPHHDEPTAMRDYLIANGVPAGHIVRDFAGRDSYDSCVRARRVFGVERLIVVGQSYHLPRAIAICRAIGVDAVGVGDDTVAVYSSAWQSGVLREWPAGVKAVIDVVTAREPVLGPPESGVSDALAAR